MPKLLEKLKYWHFELARDIALGKPEETILKRYKAFRLSKNLLKWLLEEPVFLEELKKLNEEADKVVKEVRKKTALLSLRALEILEEDMNQPKFIEQENPETKQKEKIINPFFSMKGRREIALKLVGQTSGDEKRGGVGDVHVHFSKSEPKKETVAEKEKPSIPKEQTLSVKIPQHGTA